MSLASIVTSAPRTASGNSGPIAPFENRDFDVSCTVTAVSGTTPSMTLSIQWSHDGTTWYVSDPADVFTALTATGNVIKHVTAKAAYFRLVWTITGTTPSFTFSADYHMQMGYGGLST
jgi:hypothetical protein